MKLIENIKIIQKSETENLINEKLNIFKSFKNKDSLCFFYELCFCLLTANFNAQRALKIQEKLIEDNSFIDASQEDLAKKLKQLGHRFPNKRAEFIVLARVFKNDLKQILINFDDDFQRRNWLEKNIKGLGFKESSHFLRNTGFFNVAILDFHIIDILVENNLVERPNSLTKKKYLEIENILLGICKKLNISQGKLDYYLWFLETNKVLK